MGSKAAAGGGVQSRKESQLLATDGVTLVQEGQRRGASKEKSSSLADGPSTLWIIG